MISLSEATKVYLFAEPTDMRAGFDGLSHKVKRQGLELFSGHLFVFISKRGDRIKILTWERGGLTLWYKRLERGTFKRMKGTGALQIDSGGLWGGFFRYGFIRTLTWASPAAPAP